MIFDQKIRFTLATAKTHCCVTPMSWKSYRYVTQCFLIRLSKNTTREMLTLGNGRKWRHTESQNDKCWMLTAPRTSRFLHRLNARTSWVTCNCNLAFEKLSSMIPSNMNCSSQTGFVVLRMRAVLHDGPFVSIVNLLSTNGQTFIHRAFLPNSITKLKHVIMSLKTFLILSTLYNKTKRAFTSNDYQTVYSKSVFLLTDTIYIG